jgi:hypothetical protein
MTAYGQILRATHKIAEHALISHESKKLSIWLVLFALVTALNSALRINWYRIASLLMAFVDRHF